MAEATMTTRVTAIYEHGVLRPTTALPLKDGDRIEFTVELPPAHAVPAEVLQRIRSAKTFDEWIAAADAVAGLEPSSGLDVLEALNENRRRAGERLLYPPNRKGVDW
jgi:predicted DNA-binding antitoxin AbrB/MazE fold protein